MQITANLQIYGLDIDDIILASLILKLNVLLTGPHGVGKSLLVSRLASALKMIYRHYNTAFISYDDMLSVPVPDAEGTAIYYLKSPVSIWDAEFVFFDELSRCRPDLQNKIYTVIQERTVGGQALPLQHCWSAMNLNSYQKEEQYEINYLGTEELEVALADRFAIFIAVPNWEDLDEENQKQVLLTGRRSVSDNFVVSEEFSAHFRDLIAHGRERIVEIWEDYQEIIILYVQNVVTHLLKKGYISTRRAAIIADNCMAIAIAQELLSERDSTSVDELGVASERALQFSLPQVVTDNPPDPNELLRVHKSCWDDAVSRSNKSVQTILRESDVVERIRLAINFSTEDFSEQILIEELIPKLITNAINDMPKQADKIALALAVYSSLQDSAFSLPLASWELVAKIIEPVLTPQQKPLSLAGNNEAIWNGIQDYLRKRYQIGEGERFWLIHNYLLANFEQWDSIETWSKAVENLESYIDRLSIRE